MGFSLMLQVHLEYKGIMINDIFTFITIMDRCIDKSSKQRIKAYFLSKSRYWIRFWGKLAEYL